MGEHYDNTKESSYITYVDANNLYGLAMTEPLKDIKFETILNPTTLETLPETNLETEAFRTLPETSDSETFLTLILETPDDAETGYFVEADLEFPPELHDKFKQFPPCPETLIPEVEWFCDYEKEVMEKRNQNLRAKS